MAERRKYRKKAGATVVAVQLDLDTEGFRYQKWGGQQVCRRGDWIVDNDGEVYTVDRESFSRTYRKVGRGVFEKTGYVWAEVAVSSGTIDTKEGSTDYEPGDYVVFNQADGADGYAVSRESFERMYEPAE